MIVRLHKLARTTPAIRAEIAASDESIQTLAQRYGVSPMTVFKWKHRTSFEDRPHTPHRLPTTLTAAQEIIAVQLRKTLLLSLDDLLAVMREFVNPDVSRSGLDRCLRRHGVSNLRALQPQARKATHAPFAAYEPGYVHIDVKYLPQMADEDRCHVPDDYGVAFGTNPIFADTSPSWPAWACGHRGQSEADGGCRAKRSARGFAPGLGR